MGSPRPLLRAPRPATRIRPVLGMLLALLALAAVAVPVAAVDPSPSASGSPVASPAGTASPTTSPSSSVTPSASATASPTESPVPTPTPTPSPTPSPTPTPTPSPSPTPTPPPTWPAMAWPTSATTLGTSVTFYGRGWGHGVGMNQYGAKGRAAAGQTAAEILGAYFKGASITTKSATQTVRVLLMAGYNAVSTAPLVVRGRNTEWTIDGVAGTFPVDGVLKVWRSTKTVDGVATTTWRYRVYAADTTTMLASGTAGTSLVVRGTTSTSRLQLVTKPSSYDTYRGRLKLNLLASSLNVINYVALDDYLRGVVPVEMSSAWPAEALKAQTIAARSYAVRRLHPGTGSFDVYDDTRSQVYRGSEAERTTTNTIIRGVAGKVLVAGGSVVNAFFFATGGGSTENNEYVFVSSTGGVGSPVSYLRGIPDRRPDGTAWDSAAPDYAWRTTTLTRDQLSAMFGADARTNVGQLTKLDLTKRGVSGRLYRVTLIGTTGSKTVSADVFRAVYNARRPAGTLSLKANLFDTRPLAGS